MADAGPLILPPSYSNIDGQAARGAGSELKQSFESLKTEHNDIQELFRTVKAQLQNTPEIGEYHPLIEKWDELRVRHKRIFRDSQQNASMCSRFLKNFGDILVPLSQSPDMPIEQKRVMIDKFLETIPVHMNTARENAESFNELAKEVEVFPRKVAAALRVQAQNMNLFDFVWNTIKQFCMDLWRKLNEMLNKVVDIFKTALQRIDKLQFNTCFGVSLDVHMRPHYPSLELPSPKADDHELTPRELQRAVEDNAGDIARRLSAFEGAWHVVGNACSQLSADLELAKGFTTSSPPVPQAVDQSLKAAALVHEPLVECLGSYSLCN